MEFNKPLMTMMVDFSEGFTPAKRGARAHPMQEKATIGDFLSHSPFDDGSREYTQGTLHGYVADRAIAIRASPSILLRTSQFAKVAQ